MSEQKWEWPTSPKAPAVEAASPGITAEFKDWFEREWSSYRDKAISGGKVVSMAWALKGYRTAPPAASAQKGLSDEQIKDIAKEHFFNGMPILTCAVEFARELLRESKGK